ncbi:MAG: pectate lyase [Bacteroidales bacterium]|nr:pectate lyase [Bacteroidales bacterium]
MRKHATILAALAAVFMVACGGEKNPSGGSNAPEMPADVVITSKTTHSAVIQWSEAKGAENYEWKLDEGSATVQTNTTKNTYVIIDKLSQGHSYSFVVRSVAGSEVSVWSSTLTIEIEGSTTPDNPENPESPDPEDPATPDTPVTDAVYAQFQIPAAEEDGKARAFPGAEGGGMYTTGGRGGSVYHVTNLNDNGPGSLRYGLAQSGKRTIIFDVAGIIELRSKLAITKGDVTIAGQTAPGDGICLKNYTFQIAASNVIVRFIRCRMGDETATEDDAIQILNRNTPFTNIIIDHCSVSWCTDECASFYGMKNFSFQWNIVSESLRESIHEKGTHGYGGIWGGEDAAYHHNLLAHHDSRNPRIDHDYVSTQKGPLNIVNNVIYNWRGNTCYGGESKSGSERKKYNIINNYYKPGPATSSHYWFLDITTSCSNCEASDAGSVVPGCFYMTGNYMLGQNEMNTDNWKGTSKTAPSGCKSGSAFTYPDNPTTIRTQSAQDAFNSVLNGAGASLKRDAVDVRIAGEVRNGKATYKGSKSGISGLIDTQGDVGGWPEYKATSEELAKVTDTDGDGMPDWFEDQFGLKKNEASDGKQKWLDKNGRYTNLEMYLQYLVKEIVITQYQ